MSLTQDELYAAFSLEVGSALLALTSEAEHTKWWNEGVNRFASGINRYKALTDDITWAAAAREVALNTDFIELDKIVTASGYVFQPWRVFGENLVLDDPDGATQAGAARVYYWGEWPLLADGGTSPLTYVEDYAILNFTLSRFYKKLCSSRLYYKRYATIVGQNGVSIEDLQSEADRWMQDFIDARDECKRVAPAFYYEG